METGSRRPTIVVVACVLLGSDGSVLLARRPEGRELAGLWEFPGGKIEPGEQPEEALVRELEEELGVRAKRENLVPLTFVSHSYRELPSAHAALSLRGVGGRRCGQGGAGARLGPSRSTR